MVNLQAGPLALLYDQGFPRRIMLGNTEVIRMVYFALRDHNWLTIPHQIRNEKIEQDNNSFRITYDCVHLQDGDEIILWKCELAGTVKGEVTFSINGQIEKAFKRNRAGFCVLHALNVMGSEVTITHPDKKTSTHKFPTFVEPDNRLKEISAMKWKADGNIVEIMFSGDVFETEDQRNWGDASFKTFCTPSNLPKPVQLRKGDSINQKIRILVADHSTQTRPEIVTITKSTVTAKLPSMGIGRSTETDALTDSQIEMLQSVKFRHYRVDVDMTKPDWVSDLSAQCEIAARLKTELEIILTLSEKPSDDIEAFVQLCLQNRIKPISVLLLTKGKQVTDEKAIALIPTVKKSLGVPVGAGTDFNFTEINKNRFKLTGFDFVSFGLHPQEHAFDDLTIVENGETCYHLVTTAREIYKGKAVHVSPITIRKRFNPYASSKSELLKTNEEKSDYRQKTELAAAWTFRNLIHLAKASCDSVTFFQTVGNQGIISHEDSPYPIYHLLKKLNVLQDRTITTAESSHPLEVNACYLNETGETLLVSLSPNKKDVRYNDQHILLMPYEIKVIG